MKPVLLTMLVLVAGCRPPPADDPVLTSPALLERARRLPVAWTYPEELHFQETGSSCGPATVVNLLRSLGRPAVSERDVLEGTDLCPGGRCPGGLTLDELAGLVRAQGLNATVLRDLTPETFREHLRRANDPTRRYLVNFSRQPIFGRGEGHHSPIGGYLEDEDLVYVLDVNRRYGPWLVKADRLFAAIDRKKGSTGMRRGLLLIEPR